MWSPPSISSGLTSVPGNALRRLLAALAIALLAGCAAGPDGKPPPAARAADGDVPAAALTLYERATAAMAAGDSIEAQLRFQEFLLEYPAYPGAHVNLAILKADNGDDEAARESIDAALSLDPDYAPALNQLGMLLRRNGDFSGSEAAYLKAVTVNPDYALAHYNLGVLNELYLQRLDVALEHFERYQELTGDDEQVEKWIADLRRRVEASQRTANVAD